MFAKAPRLSAAALVVLMAGASLVVIVERARPAWSLVGSSCAVNGDDKSFINKMNKARSNEGAGKLKLDSQLTRVAKKHTKEMMANSTLEHTTPDVLGKRVTNWAELGENIGFGSTVSSLHKAFMNSPSHRDNILYEKFRYVGVGTFVDKDDKMWVTVVFEAENDPGTTLSGC